jgi:predicted component of type VI protein secretion system
MRLREKNAGADINAHVVSLQKVWWISKQHCTIFQQEGSFYIEDKLSTNGTKLNGIEIRDMGKQKLNDNDEIIIADVIKVLFKLRAQKNS